MQSTMVFTGYMYSAWIVVIFTLWKALLTKGECGPPPIIERSGNNATLDAVFPAGTEIRYFCDVTSYRHGLYVYTCQNGTWTNGGDSDLQCIWKTCRPPSIEHGTYSVPSLTVGNTARFQCDEGYTMRGLPRAVCRINSQWRRLPTCHVVKCSSPRWISHMTRFQDGHGRAPNIYGNHVHNECEEGYTLVGPSVQTCEGNGHWTSPAPYCKEINCGPPSVGNGTASYDSTTFVSTAWIECDEDAVFEGDEFIFCFEDGWTHAYCHGPCEVPSVENGRVEQSLISYNQSVVWSCKPGFIKNVQDDITCNQGALTQTPSCRELQFGNDSTCPAPFQPGYHVVRFHDKCYIFIDVHVEYWEAKQRCLNQGWVPVMIENEAESEFVSMATRQLWDSSTWLGIEYSDKEDAWINLDGTRVHFTDWLPGEGGKSFWFIKFEKCAVMEGNGDRIRKWNDIECDSHARVMCQVEPIEHSHRV